jgi:hypothetical protein
MRSASLPLTFVDDIETIFSHVLVSFVPSAIGRGQMVAVIVQNPLFYADGTDNAGEIFVGSASNMIYSMIPGQESPIIYAEDEKDVYVKLKFPFPNPNGAILTVTVELGQGGAGYTAGNVLILPSPSAGLSAAVTVLTVGGPVSNAVLNAGGALYVPGDILQVTGGNGLARIVVDTVDGGGAVLTFHISVAGDNYQNTVGNGTTGGTGAGAKFNITTPNHILTINLTFAGTGFTGGTNIAATGGSGEGAIIRVLTVENSVPETADVNLLIYRRRFGGKQ